MRISKVIVCGLLISIGMLSYGEKKNISIDEEKFYFHVKSSQKLSGTKLKTEAGKNLLRNGSFEVDALDGWWPSSRIKKSIADKLAKEGKQSLGIVVRNNWKEVRSELRKVVPGKNYIFSVYLRADKKCQVKLGLRSGLKIASKKKYFPGKIKTFWITPEWKRYSVACSFPKTMKNASFVSIKPIHRGKSYTLYADCAKLEAGAEMTEYSPHDLLTIGLQIKNTGDYVYKLEEKVPVEVSLYSKALRNKKVKINFKLEDLFGVNKFLYSKYVTLNEQGRFAFTENIKNKFYGSVRLIVEAVSADKVLSNYQICWSSLRPPRQVDADKSPFGMHIYVSKDSIPLERKMGVKWDRLHDMGKHHLTRWTQAEPKKGKFVFADKLVDTYKKNGIKLLAVLFATPKWAADIPAKDVKRIMGNKSPNSAQGYKPKNLQDFADYVKTMVKHYGKYIKHWEMWNEPYGVGFWRGTAEEYVELLKAGYQAVKSVDPDAVVLGGNVYHTHTKWMKKIFKAGALKYMDVLPFHQYGEQQDRATRYGREKIQKLIDFKNKYGGTKIPLWNSEGGENCSDFNTQIVDGLEGDHVALPTPDYIEASAALVRKYVYSLSMGVQKIMYYFSVSRDYYSNFNMFSIRGLHGNLKPVGTAYSALAFMIDGLKFEKRVVIDNIAEVYIFANVERSVAVIWGNGLTCFERGMYLKINTSGQGIKQYDISGNLIDEKKIQLSAIPRYLTVPIAVKKQFMNSLKNTKVIDTMSVMARKAMAGMKGKNVRSEGYALKSYLDVSNAVGIAVFARNEDKTKTEWRLFVKANVIDELLGGPEVAIKINGLKNVGKAKYNNGILNFKVACKPYYVSFETTPELKRQVLKALKQAKLNSWTPVLPITQALEVKAGKKKTGSSVGNGYNRTSGLGPNNQTTYVVPPLVNGRYYIYIVVRAGGFAPDDYGKNYSIKINGHKVSGSLVGPKIKTHDAGPGKYKNFMGTYRSNEPVFIVAGQKIIFKSNRAWSSSGNCTLRKVK